MARTFVSPKYQIIVPREICEEAGLKVGQPLQVIVEGDGVIALVPELPIEELRGFAKGVPANDLRDKKDRY